MKKYTTALLFGVFYLAAPFAQADVIDDAIGNIQQAFSDAYKPGSDRVYHDDRDEDDRQDRALSRQNEERYRQLESRRRQLDDRQNQLDRERRQLDDEEHRLQDDEDR